MRSIYRQLLVAALFTALIGGPAAAATMYVTDILRLAVRSGPGYGHDTVTTLVSGQKMEVLDTQADWVRVRLPDGTEGWVQEKYLTAEMTDNLRLAALQKAHQALGERAAALEEENRTIKAELKTLRAELQEQTQKAEELGRSYEALRTESADYLKLKTRFEQTAAMLAEQTAKADRLEQELGSIESRNTIRWFLAGAGVLLLGLIIGFSAKRQRRRTFLSR
jgi:SH3 domain protein